MITVSAGAVVRESMLAAQPASAVSSSVGAEGVVVTCDATPYLFKRYATKPNGETSEALQRLVDLPAMAMSHADKALVARSFSWPRHRVVDDSLQTVGVLIPRAEPRHTFHYAGAWHLRDGQHVVRAETVAGVPTPHERARYARDLAVAWDVLDRHGLVYGDANARNLLFSPTGTPTVYFLDCDGIRPETDATLTFRTHPNWSDPYSSSAITRSSDRYLLALWTLRILAGEMVRPSERDLGLDALSRLPRRRDLDRLLTAGLGPHGARPAPSEYIPVLTMLAT